MSKALIVFDKKTRTGYQPVVELIREYFRDLAYEVDELCVDSNTSQEECRLALTEARNDYICTLDLACFQMPTLLETSLYNILPAKQIHIVIDTKKLLAYKGEDFALNLFVCVPDAGRQWEEEFPNIPNLIRYQPFELQKEQGREMIRQTVWKILDEVKRECEI